MVLVVVIIAIGVEVVLTELEVEDTRVVAFVNVIDEKVDISVDVPTVEFDSVVFKKDVVIVDVGVAVVVLAFVIGNGVKVVVVFGSRKNEVRLTLLAVEGVLIKVLAMEGVVNKVLAFAEEFKFG